jgi:AcrR family transcriptional regulator
MGIADRKQRERQARLNLILNAGLSVFARLGYHNASMDLIAEEAELGKATLYYYFRSKDELLMAILENGVQEFFQHLEQKLPRLPSPLEQIQEVIRQSIEFFHNHPDYFRLYLYLNAHPHFRRQILQRLQPAIRSKLTLFRKLFEQASREGYLKEFPINQLISVFGSLVMGVGIFMEEAAQKEPEHIAALISEIFLHGVLKNPQSKPSSLAHKAEEHHD